MGLANSSLEKHKEAVDNFKKALELEPDNESYKSNLQIAEDKVRDSPGDYTPQLLIFLFLCLSNILKSQKPKVYTVKLRPESDKKNCLSRVIIILLNQVKLNHEF